MVNHGGTMVDHGLANHGWKHGSHHGWSLVNHCQPWFNHGWPWLTMLPWLMFRLWWLHVDQNRYFSFVWLYDMTQANVIDVACNDFVLY